MRIACSESASGSEQAHSESDLGQLIGSEVGGKFAVHRQSRPHVLYVLQK